MSAGAGPSAPPTSLQHIYNSIFRGMPPGHIARSASQSIGMASLKLPIVDMNMVITVSVVCPLWMIDFMKQHVDHEIHWSILCSAVLITAKEIHW